MANILTDPSATYGATATLVTKTNNTPRVDSDSAQWVIAQWGNEVDTALKALSTWLQGDAQAGAAGKTLQYLGSVGIAESLFVLGGNIEFGGDALVSAAIKLHGSNVSTTALYFSDPGSDQAAGIVVDQSAEQMDIRVQNASRFQLTSSAFRATNHNVVDLGDSTHRWREAYIDKLFAISEATIGNGGDTSLTINGSSTGGAEPKVYFSHGGTPVVIMQASLDADGILFENATSGGKFSFANAWSLIVANTDTATRTSLANDSGATTFDTDTNTIWYNDGSMWHQLGAMPTVRLGVSESMVTTNPAAYGETGGGSPVVYFSANATNTVHWHTQISEHYKGGNLTIKLHWTGTTASAVTNVRWILSVERYANGLDLSVSQATSTTFTEPGPAAIYLQKVSTWTVTNANMDSIQAGDFIRVTLTRDGPHANDTYTGSAGVIGMQISQ